jgi:orc1/cdc6 family replication initiation protein
MIADARVLDPEFVPNDVVQRDAEINLLSSDLRPAVNGEPTDSAILSGPSGTVKTCIAQYTLEKLRQSTVELNTQYVNCWEDHTHFSVLYRVLEGIDNTLDIHRKSTPQDVLLERLHDYDGPPYIVILDEADQLDTTDVLYELLRTRRLSFILITNDNDTLIPRFDERLASRLRTATRIQFDPYSLDALTSILEDRTRWGLHPDTITDRQLETIADAAAGDARVAIGTLRQAAQRATSEHTDTITDTHIEAAVPDAKAEIKQKNLSRLTRHQRVLYDIIHDSGTVTPGALYERYTDQVDDAKTKRMVRNYLQKLAQYNLISAQGTDRARRYSRIN